MARRVLEQLARWARERSDSNAITIVAPACSAQCTVSCGELHRRTMGIAGMIRRRAANGGEVVMLAAPNGPHFVPCFLGALAANCTVFPVHPGLAAAELHSAARRSGARIFIGATSLLEPLRGLDAHCIDIDALGSFGDDAPPQSCGDLDRAALMLQSSGTTGQPKIVLRSGASLDAVASNVVEAVGLTRADRVLAAMPLCHSYGVENGLLAPILAGAAIHLAHGFDPASIARHFAEAAITIFPAVPFMIQVLVERHEGVAMPRLRKAYSAGGPLPPQLAAAFEARFGVPIGQLYGSTEVGSVTFADPNDPGFVGGSVGRAMRGVRIEILDPDQPRAGAPLPAGVEGLVAIAAPSMLERYVDDDTPPLSDGLFHTGDLGRLDARGAGNLTITGRVKLQIDIGGMKVNPLEVEQVLSQHPAVRECVIVPQRVSDTVDRLKAIIALRADGASEADLEGLRQFARARLASYKVPRVFEVRAGLPRSPSGKILREALRCE